MAQGLKVYGSKIEGLWLTDSRFMAQELKVYSSGIECYKKRFPKLQQFPELRKVF